MLTELTSRYFDLDGAREHLRAHIESEVPTAQSAVQEALSELGRAESRIAKVIRGWQDEIVPDDEYRHQRADLDAERDGAQAALEQAEHNLAQIEALASPPTPRKPSWATWPTSNGWSARPSNRLRNRSPQDRHSDPVRPDHLAALELGGPR